MAQPVAFISHTSDDDDFCDPLYRALQANGVMAIMDKHDFKPGDDLVKRIFDQGIGESDAVIFVLSPTSVNRPWVRDELSVSVVHKLRDATRLIPIILKALPDDEVPTALAATVWIRVKSEDNPGDVAKEIANVLHLDAAPNPVVEPGPKWTVREVTNRLGFDDRRDEILFAFACQRQLEHSRPFVDVPEILAYATEQGLTQDDVRASIAVFRKMYFIEDPPAKGGLLPNGIRIKRRPGLELYLKAYESERYRRAHNETLAAILNKRAFDLDTLTSVISEKSPVVLETIIDIFGAQQDLIVVRPLNGPTTWNARDSLPRRPEV